MATDYHTWEDADRLRQVRWYGGSQVNLYVRYPESQNWREVNVASRAEWWERKPTIRRVDHHARALLTDSEYENLWIG